MSAPNLRTEAAAAGNYPEKRFNQRERKLLQTVSNAVKGGQHTTTGGSSTEIIPAPGVSPTDAVSVTLRLEGASPVTVVSAAAGLDAITVQLSADPADDHSLNWIAVQTQ